MSMDTRELRNTLGCFLTGVTVVTAVDENGRPVGFTANSFTSVSLDPPLVLVCLARSAGLYEVFNQVGGFAVNVLSEEQRAVSGNFATKPADRFDGIAWQGRSTGCPVLDGSLAWLDCEVDQRLDAGDHLVLIGRVIDFDYTHQTPLGYYRGNYIRFSLEQQVVGATPDSRLRVGVILEHEGRIMLLDDGDGGLDLPEARGLGESAEDAGSLLALLRELGIDASIGFLFAVFDDAPSARMLAYYLGEVNGIDAQSPDVVWVDSDRVPFDRLPTEAVRSMMRRYINERCKDRFGVYVGDWESGTVSLPPNHTTRNRS